MSSSVLTSQPYLCYIYLENHFLILNVYVTGNSFLYSCSSSWTALMDDIPGVNKPQQNPHSERNNWVAKQQSKLMTVQEEMIREMAKNPFTDPEFPLLQTWHILMSQMRKNKLGLSSCIFFKQQQHIQSSGTCLNASCIPADLDFFILRIAFCKSSWQIGRIQSPSALLYGIEGD